MGRSSRGRPGWQEISLQLYVDIIAAESDRVCAEKSRTRRKVKQRNCLVSCRYDKVQWNPRRNKRLIFYEPWESLLPRACEKCDVFPPARRVSTQQSSLCVFACSSHFTSRALRTRLSRESSDLLEVNPKLTTFACLRWGKKQTLLELSLVACRSVVVCGKYTKINVSVSLLSQQNIHGSSL